MAQVHQRGEPFFMQGESDVGCLLIHGWTSAPQEMYDLGVHLNDRGHSVLGLRLPGHATHPNDLNRMRWQDWVATVEDGYSMLDSRSELVVVMGLSLGGVLALILGTSHPVAGVVAMATPYRIPPTNRLGWLRLMLPFMRPMSAALHHVPKPPVNDYKDQQAYRDHLSYSVFPIRSVPEVDRLLGLMRDRLPDIQTPILLMHAVEDRGVSPDNARAIYSRVASKDKELVWIEDSGHVITVEPARRRVYNFAASFVDRIAEGAS